MKILIDTDPGVDDSLALAFGYSTGLPIVALTTVHGNSEIVHTTRNAGYIAKSLGADWRIYRGAEKPLEGEGRRAYAHGAGGLGSVVPPPHEVLPAQPESAADFFAALAQGDDSYALFCLGPVTNIAAAFRDSPAILDKISKLVIMGGAFSEKGNVTPYAEFNVYNDPAALQLVLDRAGEARIDTTIIPAETCRRVVLTEADLVKLGANSVLPNVRAIVGPYLEYYLHRASDRAYEGAVLYDVLVPLYYQQPDLFTTRRAHVTVVRQGKRKGQTVAVDDEQSSIKITTSVDVAAAQAVILQALGA